MKKRLLIPVLAALMIMSAAAQDKEWKSDNKYAKHFDTNTIETYKGKISAVYLLNSEKGLGSKIKFDLATGDDIIRVHVGPSWYIEDKGFKFEISDRVVVTGSRVKIGENDILIATEIVKDNKMLKLRDSKGTPLWIGWGFNGLLPCFFVM